MRIVFALWALPLAIFWGWFFLSLNDMNFGYVMLTRDVHDIVFDLYGEMLGIDPVSIPLMLAKACVLDTVLLAGIWAFRRRRELTAWFHSTRLRYSGKASSLNR